jgi:putative glutamine amidotransferase
VPDPTSSKRHLPPRIGLTTYREPATWGVWNEPADLLPATYRQAVELAGGVALLLPPPERDIEVHAQVSLQAVHGLLLTGGPDVDPARYGAQRDAHTGPARSERDEWEITLTRQALQLDIPVLGVCRGLQTLNVALGGTLIQHLPDRVSHPGHSPHVGVHGRHNIHTAPGTRIAAIHGPRAEVATYHHQALDVLAPGFVATAWAEDNTVEAAELNGNGWVMGVQWHPEVHNGAALFSDLVAACTAHRLVSH